MQLNHYMPVKLVTGKDCVKKSAAELAALGHCCLIVTGRSGARACGALEDVTATLQQNGQRWVLFDTIGSNPKLTDCMAAAERAIAEKTEFVIGIGGGSPQDAAKCIAVLAANPGMTQQQLYAFDWANAPQKIVLVGTTAGTGSEVTKVSVITTPGGRKKSFHHPAIFATLALGDPTYTMSLTENTTRATAVDALAHCAESYFNRSANHLSRLYAAEGIRILLPLFRRMVQQGFGELTYEEREQLYTASIYGGLAINITGTAFPHNVGYLLTEQFGVPHGTACAVFQEAFFRHNRQAAPELTERFLSDVGTTGEEYCALLKTVTPPCEVVLTENVIAAAHPRWINNGSINKCLGTVTADQVDAILRGVFAG